MIGTTIGHYTITAKLDIGSLGEAWLADNKTLNRSVVLKILPASLAREDTTRKRFLREARTAGSLEHPNIAAVHEVGELPDGRIWVAMSWSGGTSLREKEKAGPLPVEEAVGIAIQIGRGLAKAHDAGMVHRDVTPENVVVGDDGRVRIVDFAVAKLASSERLTRTGTRTGTVAYMSPEQVAGKEVDARSDIWALGVVLYEMLSGSHPFEGADENEVITKVLKADVKDTSGKVPWEVGRIIGKALEREARDRYASIGEMVGELEWAQGKVTSGTLSRRVGMVVPGQRRKRRVLVAVLGAVAAVVLVGAGVIGYLVWKSRSEARAHGADVTYQFPSWDRATIALLPVADTSGIGAEDTLGDVVTDGLMTDLVKIHGLRVISQSSAEKIAPNEPIAEARRKLGVDYVLRGSAARDGDHVRLSFELWQTGTIALYAAHNVEPGTWSVRRNTEGTWAAKEFRGTAADLNVLLAQVAQEAARNASVEVTTQDRTRIAGEKSIKPETREMYLKGRKLADDTGDPASLKKAIAFLWQAVESDPNYAEAWAELAKTLSQPGVGDAASAATVSVDEALARALELDPASAEVQLALGSASGNLGRYTEQKAALEAAITANPNLAQAHSSYALLLARYKRYGEALVEATEGVRLDPLSMTAIHSLVLQHIWSRHYPEGISAILKVLELSPDDPLALRNYGWALAEMGRHDEGLQYLEKAVKLGAPGGEAYLGYALAKRGDLQEARAVADGLARHWHTTDAQGAQQIAMVYANTGEAELAMQWLRKAATAGGPEFLRGLDMSAEWDPLAPRPEFREMTKMPDWPVAALPASGRTGTGVAGTTSRPVAIMSSVGHTSSDAFYKRLHDYIVAQTGVAFTYRDVAWNDYGGELKAAIAARSRIDLFLVPSPVELLQYRVRRVIQDITDPVNRYGHSIKRLFTEARDWSELGKGDLWRPVTIEGRIWAVPEVFSKDIGVVLSVRRDWREKLGMGPIETIDQFEAYLRKVKVTDLNGNGAADEIPFNPMYGDAGLEGIASSMTFPFIGAVGWHHDWYQSTYLDAQGRVTPTVLHPEFRIFLARMAEWYRDGLLPPELVTSSGDRDNELLAADRVGATACWYSDFYPAWQTLVGKVPGAAYEHVVLRGPGGSPGRRALAGAPSAAQWAYASWSSKDAVAGGIKLQDWFAANESSYLVQYHGVQGADWRYVRKRTGTERALIEHVSDKDYHSYSFLHYGPWDSLLPAEDWESERRLEAYVALSKQPVWFRPDWFVLYDFAGTAVGRDDATAAGFINQAIADIITNNAPLAGWDAKAAEYRAMWADQFINLATAQYNRAIGKK
jgi:eukaryotic-like serine/threonine-protein kinase